jgi:hypothetical protein
MSTRRCSLCGKVLPKGQPSDICSLCSIGLVPNEPLGMGTRRRGGMPVGGRSLSGLHCPHCGAELSFADIKRRGCSICNEAVTLDTALLSEPAAGKGRLTPRTGSRTEDWPDDAPRR